jgi:hypothetical protein
MLRISLIGPGDTRYHFLELLGMDKADLDLHLDSIAKAVSEHEIVLLPDGGACFEVAKRYRDIGGKKVCGTVPIADKDFGIAHLEAYINSETHGKKIFEEIIDTHSWYRQDLLHCLFGDCVLMLGNSLGSMGEMAYAYYIYKIFNGGKPEVNVPKKAIHPKIIAGDRIPFSLIVYMPFFRQSLGYELESYIAKIGGKVYYVKDSEELKETLGVLDSIASK